MGIISRMTTGQVLPRLALLLMLLAGSTACVPQNSPIPTATKSPPTVSPTPPATHTPSPVPTSTATPLTCFTEPGRVEEGILESTNPPQEYRIYLPPCHDERIDRRYPVLYLLHGQTYTDDQWIRLGAVDVADRLIRSGEAVPFIIVFPDDRYWNLPPAAGFGQRLIEELIPFIDSTYRTLPSRNQRAIGGLSRGAGWALRLGLTRWDLFSSIGLHSLAVLQGDASDITDWLEEIPSSRRPRVFMDIGDNDPELSMAGRVESYFTDFGLSHEWHLYGGAHTEEYWTAHVEEYIRWYAEAWNSP